MIAPNWKQPVSSSPGKLLNKLCGMFIPWNAPHNNLVILSENGNPKRLHTGQFNLCNVFERTEI